MIANLYPVKINIKIKLKVMHEDTEEKKVRDSVYLIIDK